MNIKEAGRYANFLSDLIRRLEIEIDKDENIYNSVENHLKGKVNPEQAKDEKLDVTPERLTDAKVNDLAYLIVKIMDEKLALALAIENAKNKIKLNWTENGEKLTLDSAIEYNKNLRDLANSHLKYLSNYKTMVTKKIGTEHKFNAEGNQVPYKYTIELTKEINYDKNVIADLYKKLLNKTDEISKQIDAAMLLDEVNLEPKYNIHDSLEEIVNNYLLNRK